MSEERPRDYSIIRNMILIALTAVVGWVGEQVRENAAESHATHDATIVLQQQVAGMASDLHNMRDLQDRVTRLEDKADSNLHRIELLEGHRSMNP